jgi:hypothetical protein
LINKLLHLINKNNHNKIIIIINQHNHNNQITNKEILINLINQIINIINKKLIYIKIYIKIINDFNTKTSNSFLKYLYFIIYIFKQLSFIFIN